MPITTGQFLTSILLGSLPTALGEALEDLPNDPSQWTTDTWVKAMQTDYENGSIKEDKAVVDALSQRVTSYQQIFAALLTPVYLSDGKGGYAAVPVAKVVKDLAAKIGKPRGVLNTPWPIPPHPGGNNVTSLAATLDAYDEK